MSRLSRAFTALLFVASTAAVASAHDSTTGARLRLDRVEPAVPRLFVTVRNVLAPIIQVYNDTGRTFEAIGSDGLPFLRLDGRTVQANIASPDWYRSESPSPAGWVAPTARAGAEPRWVEISTGAGWAWFEHRVGAADPARETTVWSIPARIGNRALSIEGSWVRSQVSGSFRSVLDGIRPATPRLEVRILQGTQPAIFVNNMTGRVLEITGRRDEPYLRIGPGGAEQANAAGEYMKLGSTPRWAWVEPRAGWNAEDPPAEALRASEPVRLDEWGIGATLDGEPIVIHGHVEWVPVSSHHEEAAGGSGGLRWVLIAAGIVLAGAIVAIRQLRNRRRASSMRREGSPGAGQN